MKRYTPGALSKDDLKTMADHAIIKSDEDTYTLAWWNGILPTHRPGLHSLQLFLVVQRIMSKSTDFGPWEFTARFRECVSADPYDKRDRKHVERRVTVESEDAALRRGHNLMNDVMGCHSIEFTEFRCGGKKFTDALLKMAETSEYVHIQRPTEADA